MATKTADVRAKRKAASQGSKIQVYYTKKGAWTFDYGRTADGRLVPFTVKVAKAISEHEEPLKRVNGSIVGRITLSDKKPFLTLDRSETELIEAFKNHELCEGSPNAAFKSVIRVIDPDKIEEDKGKNFLDVKKALNAYLQLTNDNDEFMLLADALNIKKSKADMLFFFKELAEKRPNEFLSYVEEKGEHNWVLTDKMRVDAILRKAIKAKIVKESDGLLVYRNERLGKDFKDASVALRDSTPNKGKEQFYTLIKEDLQENGLL